MLAPVTKTTPVESGHGAAPSAYRPRVAVREQLRRRWRPVRRAVLSRRRPIAAVLAAAVGGRRAARGAAAAARGTSGADRRAGPARRRHPDRPRRGDGRLRAGHRADRPRAATRSGGSWPLRCTPASRSPTSAWSGAPLAAAYAGDVALPVRLPDAGMAGLLRVGDRIDLVAADPQGDEARLVASGVTVLALPAADDEEVSGALPGRLVVVAAPAEVRDGLVQAAVTGFLTFTYAR